MKYVLKRETQYLHHETREPVRDVSYYMHTDFFVFATHNLADAKTFATKAEAASYARKHLAGNGYKPEPVNAAQ